MSTPCTHLPSSEPLQERRMGSLARRMSVLGLLAVLGLLPLASLAQSLPAVTVSGSGQNTQYSLSLQLLALMTTLTLLPSMLLMLTSFVRIVIVLSILRQALGTGQTPTNLVPVGLYPFQTLFTIALVLGEVNQY